MDEEGDCMKKWFLDNWEMALFLISALLTFLAWNFTPEFSNSKLATLIVFLIFWINEQRKILECTPICAQSVKL